jgi:HPt (histidine-containing phosphotransfer) domain-containing protein
VQKIPDTSQDLFNAGHLTDLLEGDRAVIAQVYELFLSETQTDLGKLERVIATRDLTTARGIAHSLKGAAANIGCDRLSRIACDVETAIKTKNLILARQHWVALRQAFLAAEIAIQQWLQHSR